ncbi:chromosome partitioning protein ParB [Bombiscardovia apis]|uniref:Chromosome partitioning protein ParB n=1 Tax=Bombiscardovia apis TaxID=2932182 RepID=A0ABN6SJ91_9BIFI|nr:ParB/RepB/Spo0J family partition protein [Bombiscardovia apis]BDR55432.1 chromosome partitioning protein ParB [Bombiscardovia apis]
MAKRSRLGKGLGALFPALPGEGQEETASEPAASASASESNNASVETNQAPAKTSASKASKSSATKSPRSKTSSGAKPVSETASAGKKSSTAGASSKTREGANKSGKTNVSRETAVKKTRPNRMSVPKLSDLEHPSDLFFGGAEQNVSRETLSSKPVKNETVIDTSKPTEAPSEASKAPTASVTAESADAGLQPVQGGYLAELAVSGIQANADQPRRIFDEDELIELSHSITEVGLLQPIVVRKLEEGKAQSPDVHYEIIMGERRWRATTMAGIEKIPAIVKTTADNDMLRDALLENLHRVALNPLEEAAAYQQMMDEFGMTQEELSKSVSKSRPQIANMLRLLKLPPVVQKKVESGVLSAGHARALLALSTPEDMEALADKIISEGLSVRSTEELVALKTSDIAKKPRKQKASVWAGSPLLGNLENRFETKVDIKGTEKRGRIEITYSSPDDMNRILSLLLEQKAAQAEQANSNDGWV